MVRPRYSVADLLLATALIASGIGLPMAVSRVPTSATALPELFTLLGGFALAGAGYGSLFQAKVVGAVWGFFCGVMAGLVGMAIFAYAFLFGW